MYTDSAIYQRVSDGTDKSVEQQNHRNEAAARERGWSSTSYSDAVSASRFARRPRPEWERLVSDVRAGMYRYVVLWESSRGDRKLSTWATFLDACRETDTRIYVTSHDRLYSMRNASDWKALANDGIDSAYESEKTSLRVRRDLADAALRGEPHGRIPYGYTRRYERVDGRPKPLPIQYPHPTEAPIAREIITRIASQDSVSGILYDLRTRGIARRDGKPWANSSLVAMVLNGVVYIGKRRHNGGELLPGNWPPLVDEDVYWAAVAVLRDPARKTAATTRGGIRPGAARWLLSHIATCSVCGYPLGQQQRPYKGEKVPFYRCNNPRASHCFAPVEWMDWLVGEAVVRWCAQPLVYATITEGSDREALAARDEVAAERHRLAEFEAQAIAGTLSATAYARIASGIEARIADLDAKATQTGAPAELNGLLGGRTEDIAERWLAMPLLAQRSVIRKIAAPTLAPTGRGGRLLDFRRVKPNLVSGASEYHSEPVLPIPAVLR